MADTNLDVLVYTTIAAPLICPSRLAHACDRVPGASGPNRRRLDGCKPAQLPVAMEFVARRFDAAPLFEVAAASEAATCHPHPPPGSGAVAGEA